jgi:hypothetical protein
VQVEHQLSGLRADLSEKIKLVYTSEMRFDLRLTQPFDYELDKRVEFSLSVIYKTPDRGQVFLFKARIVINIVDANDNKPRFLTPFVKNQLVSVDMPFVADATATDQLRSFLMRVEASDADASVKYAKLKYALVETVCYLEQCDFSVNLNELTGELFLIRQFNFSSEATHASYFDFGLKIRVYNYMDLLNPSYVTTRFRIVARTTKAIEFVESVSSELTRLDSSKY